MSNSCVGWCTHKCTTQEKRKTKNVSILVPRHNIKNKKKKIDHTSVKYIICPTTLHNSTAPSKRVVAWKHSESEGICGLLANPPVDGLQRGCSQPHVEVNTGWQLCGKLSERVFVRG